jgi:hypothetical protein
MIPPAPDFTARQISATLTANRDKVTHSEQSSQEGFLPASDQHRGAHLQKDLKARVVLICAECCSANSGQFH